MTLRTVAEVFLTSVAISDVRLPLAWSQSMIYGELAVNEFLPKKLKVVREQIRKGKTLCRNQINRYTSNIKRIFAWGVEEEIVQSNISHALRVVKNLPPNEPGTFDHPETENVPLWVVSATMPFLAPVVAVMVQIQWLLVRYTLRRWHTNDP